MTAKKIKTLDDQLEKEALEEDKSNITDKQIDKAIKIMSKPITKEIENEIVKEIMGEKKKDNFGVKEVNKDIYLVVDNFGRTVRVYERSEECENPQSSATQYAQKLNK
jgi:Na+/phosphate symporter